MTVALIFSVGDSVVSCLAPCWASLVHDWQESNGMSHSEGVWSSISKNDPFKARGLCTGFEDAGFFSEKDVFSEKLKKLSVWYPQ